MTYRNTNINNIRFKTTSQSPPDPLTPVLSYARVRSTVIAQFTTQKEKQG